MEQTNPAFAPLLNREKKHIIDSLTTNDMEIIYRVRFGGRKFDIDNHSIRSRLMKISLKDLDQLISLHLKTKEECGVNT